MAKRQVYIQEVGLVTILKRRGNTNLRLSVKPDHQVVLSMPYWAPYKIGEQFVKSRSEWIHDQLQKIPAVSLQNGDQIGKHHHIYFQSSNTENIKVTLTNTEIKVSSCLASSHNRVQLKSLIA